MILLTTVERFMKENSKICMLIPLLTGLFGQTSPMQMQPQTQMPMGKPQAVQQLPNPELESAIQKYEALQQEYPEAYGLNYNLGNLKYLNGDYENAEKEYKRALAQQDDIFKSHSLYNLGNTSVKKGNPQKGLDYYRQALELNPDDDDIKYNYEMSKLLLQQQQQQQQQGDENKENQEENQQEQEEQQQQQQQDGQEEQDQQDQSEEQDGEEQEEQQQQQENAEEQKEEDSQQQQPKPTEMTEEEKLDREEAEAILNALKANEENLMKKKYQAKGKITVEKDW